MTDDEIVMHKTIARIAEGNVKAVRVSAEHYQWLATSIAAERATIKAIAQTAGGTVDGQPTQALHVLQRVRSLRTCIDKLRDMLNFEREMIANELRRLRNERDDARSKSSYHPD